jgi:MinD-like ATPase involved in chromosome partitioning or flagellar assembly
LQLAKIVSTHSFRGGTGKSNITANIAVLIARAGKRVGVIDTDIQSPGIHVLFGLDERNIAHCLNDYLRGHCCITQTACDVTAIARQGPAADVPGLFLIPASLKPGEIAKVLRDGYDLCLLNDGIQALIDTLKLDYLLIDTHPGVNEETLFSIGLSDLMLLLLRPDNQDYQGTAVTVELARRLAVRDMQLVINKVPPGMDSAALRQQAESAYRTPVLAPLPLNFEIVHLASGGIFCLHFPDHPLTHGLGAIARYAMR